MNTEYQQVFLSYVYNNRIKNGAFQRFKFPKKYLQNIITMGGFDTSGKYFDRICLN